VKKTLSKTSAGILAYHKKGSEIEVLLVHPGGPFWTKKDESAWSIPKGELLENEDPLTAAKREFNEETGFDISGEFCPLTPLRQPSGKIIFAWIIEGDLDAKAIKSNTFSLEWPRGSGNVQEFSEIDRADWFTLKTAKLKIVKGQVGFLNQLEHRMDSNFC
jgi:predicted NUDIX family NTP pyrophosphohydrolase